MRSSSRCEASFTRPRVGRSAGSEHVAAPGTHRWLRIATELELWPPQQQLLWSTSLWWVGSDEEGCFFFFFLPLGKVKKKDPTGT